jgi:hypothetical protein
VTNAVVGVVHAVSLSIHAIGIGLASARGLQTKHAIKQVDRLLSHPALDVWALFAHWVPPVVAADTAIVVALDWTDFDADGHATIMLSLVTPHGRALPLVGRSVPKAQLKGHRNQYEDDVRLRLHAVRPAGVHVTVLADRGFGDQQLYAVLRDVGFDFIVRFRGNVTVESATGETRPAQAWVPATGTIKQLRGARVTQDRTPLDLVVCVQARGMTAPWGLAVGSATLTGAEAVRLYGRRFTIEEAFRDVKDPRYGLGLATTYIGDPRSSRPVAADLRDGHDAAHAARARRREPRHGPDAEGQHREAAHSLAVSARVYVLRGPANDAVHARESVAPSLRRTHSSGTRVRAGVWGDGGLAGAGPMTRDATTRSIDSSLIRRVTYGTDATLTVHLHRGPVYRYCTVPRVFEELLAAPSTGAYFNHHIRDSFPYQQVS